MKKSKTPEYDLQKAIASYLKLKYPKALFNSDLGGVKLSLGTARKMAAIRPFRGHPDLSIYERKGGFAGLFLELKAQGVKLKYKASLGYAIDEHQQEQYAYLLKLEEQGFCCSFAVGFDEAKSIIDAYMNEDFETLKQIKKL